VRLLVKGQVQGVGFRWFVKNNARALAITGWVRNLTDGSVEVEAQGAPAALAELSQLIQTGNSRCQVDELLELHEHEGVADDDGIKISF
jgi:acylphosphatase